MERSTETTRIAKLGLNNYSVWSRRVKFLLKSKNLWAAVNPSAEGVKTRSSSSEASDKSDEALGLIGLLVEDHLLREVDEAESAHALWKTLETMYAAKDTSRLLLLRQELASLRKIGGEAMAVYLARSKDLMADLVAVGSESQEARVVLSVLVGLPKEYGMVVEVLQMAESLTFQTIVPRLLQAELQVEQQNTERLGDIPVYGANYH
jgi:hypothetical protein